MTGEDNTIKLKAVIVVALSLFKEHEILKKRKQKVGDEIKVC